MDVPSSFMLKSESLISQKPLPWKVWTLFTSVQLFAYSTHSSHTCAHLVYMWHSYTYIHAAPTQKAIQHILDNVIPRSLHVEKHGEVWVWGSLVPRSSHTKTTRGEEGLEKLAHFQSSPPTFWRHQSDHLCHMMKPWIFNNEVLFECVLKRVDNMAVCKESKIVSE